MNLVPIRTVERIEWLDRHAVARIEPLDNPQAPLCALIMVDGTIFRVPGFAGEIEAMLAQREQTMADMVRKLGKYPHGPRLPTDEAVITGMGVALNKLGRGDEILGREIMYSTIDTARSIDGHDRSWIHKFWSGIGLFSV